MHLLIDYLTKAIEARYLGCFFWSEINLFRQLSPADLAAMRHTLSLLRQNMTRLMAHQLGYHIVLLAPIILSEPYQQLSERQLRVALARVLVISAVSAGIDCFMLHLTSSQAYMIRKYIRAAAAAQLNVVSPRILRHDFMFLALTVAPDDVMTQCRLTSRGDNMFIWDVAPLVDLLTQRDLVDILGDPAAVDAWLREHHRLSSGLSSPRALADLLLNTPLLLEALRQSRPLIWDNLQQEIRKRLGQSPLLLTDLPSFNDDRKAELGRWDRSTTLAVFKTLPRNDTRSAFRHYMNSREKARQFLDDPQTRAEYEQIRHSLQDPWRLRQFSFIDSQ